MTQPKKRRKGVVLVVYCRVTRVSEVKNRPAMQESQEMQFPFLGWEDPLEESMVTHSSTLAWRIPWTEEPGWDTVHSIAKSRTQLKQLSTHTLESVLCNKRSYRREKPGHCN